MQHVNPLAKTTHTEQNAEPTILGAFKEVPEELVLRIFSELSNPRDLASLSATCLDLLRITRDNSLWKSLFTAHFPTAASKTEPSSSLCYVDAYKRSFVLSKNQRTGWHRLQTVGSHKGMISCVDGNDQFLCSGASDGTLKIWDITTHQPVKTLEGYRKEVVSVQFVGSLLYTASYAGDVKVWDTTSWECVQEIKTTVSECCQMQVVDDFLYIAEASFLNPAHIHIYDLTEKKMIQSFPCLMLPGQIFFSQVERKWTFVGSPDEESPCII